MVRRSSEPLELGLATPAARKSRRRAVRMRSDAEAFRWAVKVQRLMQGNCALQVFASLVVALSASAPILLLFIATDGFGRRVENCAPRLCADVAPSPSHTYLQVWMPTLIPERSHGRFDAPCGPIKAALGRIQQADFRICATCAARKFRHAGRVGRI
jgi:hypothetical protein